MAVTVITRLTLLEASRRRILMAALVLGLAFLALYGASFYFVERSIQADIGRSTYPSTITQTARREVHNVLTMAGLYAVNFLSLAMGVLISADTLAGEIASGAIQTIVTKPIRRVEIVAGKWVGFAGLLFAYLLLMAVGVALVAYLVSGYIPPRLPNGLALIYLNSLLIMSLALACSSTFSTLATGGIVLGLYGLAFIGSWVEQFGAFLHDSTAVNLGILSSLLLPCEALWRRAAFEMTPPLLQSIGFAGTPFSSASVPGPLMIVYAGCYLIAAVGVAVWQFEKRDL